jgi:hypothetical protein
MQFKDHIQRYGSTYGTSGRSLARVPSNPRERTERIEKVVHRVVREHREALKKLADD